MASENLRPRIVSRVAKEIRSLVSEPMEGIELNMENTEVLTEIFANIQGPDGTPYGGGEFRVKLVLGSSFPQSPPKGFFSHSYFPSKCWFKRRNLRKYFKTRLERAT